MSVPPFSAMRAMTLCLLAAAIWPGASQALPAPTQAFLENYCFDCHNSVAKRGNLDLSALPAKLDNPALFAEWVKVHDRVRAREMPPAKRPRPNAKELDAAMTALAADLTAADILASSVRAAPGCAA